MNPTRRSTLLLPLLALTLVPAGSVMARKAYPIRPVKPPIVSHHASCLPLQGLVLDMAAQNAINSIYFYPYRYLAEASRDSKSGSSNGAGPGHFTGTNNQEGGVDEGDTVKTDGRFIYTIAQNEIIITRAWPTRSMRVVARYALPKNVTPSQLQLRGNRLVVLSSIWEASENPEADMPIAGGRRIGRGHYSPPRFAGTRVTILNIRNRTRPRLVSETDIEGWTSQTRLIGDDLYLVTNSSIRVPDAIAALAMKRAKQLPPMKNSHDWKELQELRTKGTKIVRAYLAKRLKTVDLSGAMPRTRSRLAGNGMSALQPMYSCNQLTVPGGDAQHGIVNVSQINLNRPSTVKSAGVSGGGWQIYASSSSIYVAMPDYGYNASSKTGGRTRILKFALRSWRNDGPAFAASGTVQGHLLNQFSMSEHNGFLRVMTTDQQWGRNGRVEGAANNLFVMRPAGRSLRVVGEVTGLANGERVFAARMFGDKGYMVTFRQTDPLFTFDLSNPYKPKMVGELKINGFSSYIHPLDGDRLLTIGRDADDEGRDKGLHLQIFDVSNPAKPIRTHQEVIEGGRTSYSAAQWDHKAFTFDPVTNTLALPISGYLEGGYSYDSYYSGLEVFSVTRDGFDYEGFVSHNNTVEGQRRWTSQITRSIVIGKNLVAISGVAISAVSLANVSKTLGTVSLEKKAPMPLRLLGHFLKRD